MSLIYNASNVKVCQIQNQSAPADGAKSLNVPLDFSVTAGTHVNGVPDYTLDYSNFQAQSKFSILQAIYVDNGANGSPVSMTFNGTGQTITCPANSQGYFIVLCMSPIKVDFSSAGNVAISVQLLNFPVAPAVWHV